MSGLRFCFVEEAEGVQGARVLEWFRRSAKPKPKKLSLAESIELAASIYRKHPSNAEIDVVRKLMAAGVDRRTAARLAEFTPSAYCRLMFKDSGIEFLDSFKRQDKWGRLTSRSLSSEPVWEGVMSFANYEIQSGVPARDMWRIATYSAEYSLLKQQNFSKTLKCTTLLLPFPEDGPSDEDLVVEQDPSRERELQRARELLAEKLSSIHGSWTVRDEFVAGPDNMGAIIQDQHCGEGAHVDIGFALDITRPEIPLLWDCAVGGGDADDQGLRYAVHRWTEGTLPVFLKLRYQEQDFADQYYTLGSEGCRGWHVICGPWLPFGDEAGIESMVSWVQNRSLLSDMEPCLVKNFDRPGLNGVKLFFSSSDVEVRINGFYDHEATERLRSMDYPRPEPFAFMKSFYLFVHELSEEEAAHRC